MAKVKSESTSGYRGKARPALSPEAQENRMINLAVSLAEKQLEEGTASSQVITHYLKLATVRERLEREILERNRDLIAAKTESIQQQRRNDELYAEAIRAMRNYSGNGDPDEY